MNLPKNVRGHFASLWRQSGPILIPTTVTHQYKSRARAKEHAKREELCRDIEALTGKPAARISRSIDGVNRRWRGVKGCVADS
jgi:hypothetical protein